ncbi:MAG: type IV pilus biogenesis/stability protein PilW [SAR86 cluster bacterium]|uniref:Type IV pilus biogenesis/stability protein PilW n=1 Tax=SAR86 cluster bacterium TaxID=2030880 RepID=A0A2A4XFJ4_9GAMM|nr:MAG: type IV pilus biogenesis/stability protein PilW [SAR86 cluster bacterium]
MLFLEFGFGKLLRKRLGSVLAVLLVSSTLSNCVTTTTGGFMVDASEERAATDYIQLALAYFDNGDMPGARRHVNNALDIDDRISDAYMVFAMIFEREGDLDLADSNFQRAISLDGDNSSARNNYAAMLFAEERFRESYEQLEKVASDTSYEGRSLAFEGLGRSALRLGRQEVAKAAFQRALQLNENLFIAPLELALIYFDQQDYLGARQYYRNYLTTIQFLQLPHTPRALLAGIQIEGYFENDEFVENFSLVLSTLYPTSPEYQTFQRLSDAN